MDQPKFLETITQYFKKLGLEDDQSVVLTQLYIRSPRSVVQLARKLKWGRNRIYRILDELILLQLVSKVETSYGSKYEPTGFQTLERLVKQKEQELQEAHQGLENLLQTIPYMQNAQKVASKVIHYKGIEGLKQVNWNLTKTKGIYRVYEVSRLSQFLDEKFAESLRLEWLRRGIYSRDLTNDTQIDDWSNVTEFVQKYSQYRYIDPKILKIKTEMYIYNNVVTILQYDTIKSDPNSIFCVEIYNQALADFQKQIYDILWEQAKPFKLLSPRGKSVIEDAN